MEHPLLVGIAGATCSGKTTIEHGVQRELGDLVTVLPFDDMCYKLTELEDPNIEDWEQPYLYRWDDYYQYLCTLKKGQSVIAVMNSWENYKEGISVQELVPRPVVLSVGYLALHDERVRDLFDIKLFVEVPDETIVQRRYERDNQWATESGYDAMGYIIEKILPAHHTFVVPQKGYVDEVIDGLQEKPVILNRVLEIIQSNLS